MRKNKKHSNPEKVKKNQKRFSNGSNKQKEKRGTSKALYQLRITKTSRTPLKSMGAWHHLLSEPTIASRREDTMKLMSTADNRQCENNACHPLQDDKQTINNTTEKIHYTL